MKVWSRATVEVAALVESLIATLAEFYLSLTPHDSVHR
jgi:hypothetical protein